MRPLLLLMPFTLAGIITTASTANTAGDADEQRYAIVCDPQAELCWQDPQKDAYDLTDIGIVATEAARYCDELVLGGYDDWRLPDSDELRNLIVGNPATEPGGQCSLTLGGKRKETLFRACQGLTPFGGPGINGCYLREDLTGSCNKPGPPTATQLLEIWAANVPSDDADGWQAYVSFEVGSLGYNHKNSAGDVRCVRKGLVPEQAELLPANDFFAVNPNQYGEQDPCDTSDKLVLTIKVPDKLSRTPNRLMVFFYSEDKWKFPPAGPPDGGTDYNVIMNPEFDANGEITVLLPGCTFYREKMLRGEYRVFVQLLMEERKPPMAASGDYFWGSNTKVFELPLNGTTHQGAEQPLEVTLWPVVK
jgi:hypothetical protein